MPKEYIAMQLFRTILQLWDAASILESGSGLEEAHVGSIELNESWSDEDVLNIVSDILDDVRQWVEAE
jgi:hypothetical protein